MNYSCVHHIVTFPAAGVHALDKLISQRKGKKPTFSHSTRVSEVLRHDVRTYSIMAVPLLQWGLLLITC